MFLKQIIFLCFVISISSCLTKKEISISFNPKATTLIKDLTLKEIMNTGDSNHQSKIEKIIHINYNVILDNKNISNTWLCNYTLNSYDVQLTVDGQTCKVTNLNIDTAVSGISAECQRIALGIKSTFDKGLKGLLESYGKARLLAQPDILMPQLTDPMTFIFAIPTQKMTSKNSQNFVHYFMEPLYQKKAKRSVLSFYKDNKIGPEWYHRELKTNRNGEVLFYKEYTKHTPNLLFFENTMICKTITKK